MSIKFIGQDKLLNKICSFTTDTLPHSLILYGENGSGRHTLCKIIAENFSLKYVDVSEAIGDNKLITKKYSAAALRDFLDECTLSVFPTLLILQAEDLQEKESAALLKVLEEPPCSLYIVIVAPSSQALLPTIRNRAVEFSIPKYSEETLRMFLTDNSQTCFLDYASTPGQLLSLCAVGTAQFDSMKQLAHSIFLNIHRATYSNLFNISRKFFPKGTDKFPFEIFVNLLYKACYELLLQNNGSYEAMILTFRLMQDSRNPRVNKCLLFEKYLFDLKACLR